MPSFFIRPDSPPPRHRPRPTVIPRKLDFDTSSSPPPTTTTTTNTPTVSYLDSLIQMLQKWRLKWEEDENAARLAYKRRALMSMR
ncbi:hypothetical protein Tsubulata_029608 [Turnera subulata]|uniref:Uncharacterized protein n=1 Tax=Turnera subulata TaxID=218843 RepID=A0A9Q0FFK4_9ROSI|nr:hypothetical protein Tsubulata_029608 [Turnera subulata]